MLPTQEEFMYGYHDSGSHAKRYKLYDRKPSDHLTTVVGSLRSLPSGSRVLNLGCGDGILERLAATDREYNFTSIDIEPGAIQNLKDIFAKEGKDGDQAYVGDITRLNSLPISLSATFDGAVSWRVFHGVNPTHYPEMFSLVYDALKPGGSFFISVASERDWKRDALGDSYDEAGINDCAGVMFGDFGIDRKNPFPVHFFKEAELKKLGEAAGFTLESIDYFQEASGYEHLKDRQNTYLFAIFKK